MKDCERVRMTVSGPRQTTTASRRIRAEERSEKGEIESQVRLEVKKR